MSRVLLAVLVSTALLTLHSAPASAQTRRLQWVNVHWTYEGSLPLLDSMVDVEMHLDRDRLMERSRDMVKPSGWRFRGYLRVDGRTSGIRLFGASNGAEEAQATLTVKDRFDSVL